MTQHHNKKDWPRIIFFAVGTLILIICAYTIYYYVLRDTNPIPTQIQSQLTFSPFVIPNDTKDYAATDYKYDTAENEVQIFTYLITQKDYTVTISEYPQPLEFTDIPEYKDRFLSNVINQYETVPTSNGVIYLGRAAKQNNRQLALMIERGILVFMSPNKDLDKNQWRAIGDSLAIQKI